MSDEDRSRGTAANQAVEGEWLSPLERLQVARKPPGPRRKDERVPSEMGTRQGKGIVQSRKLRREPEPPSDEFVQRLMAILAQAGFRAVEVDVGRPVPIAAPQRAVIQ
jgi:hypothetical protein